MSDAVLARTNLPTETAADKVPLNVLNGAERLLPAHQVAFISLIMIAVTAGALLLG